MPLSFGAIPPFVGLVKFRLKVQQKQEQTEFCDASHLDSYTLNPLGQQGKMFAQQVNGQFVPRWNAGTRRIKLLRQARGAAANGHVCSLEALLPLVLSDHPSRQPWKGLGQPLTYFLLCSVRATPQRHSCIWPFPMPLYAHRLPRIPLPVLQQWFTSGPQFQQKEQMTRSPTTPSQVTPGV